MKKNVFCLLMALLLFMAGNAQAQDECVEECCYSEECCCYDETNFYAKVLGGVNFLQHTRLNGNKATYQTGYIISGSLGYNCCYGFRLEGEYAFRRNEIRKIHFFGQGFSKHGRLQTSSYMANLLWDLPLTLWGCSFWDMQAFIGAGIGYDFQQMHSSNSNIIFKQKWRHFSWQLMAGLAYPIFCDADMTLEYRYHKGGCHFYNHSVGVGLVYKFSL